MHVDHQSMSTIMRFPFFLVLLLVCKGIVCNNGNTTQHHDYHKRDVTTLLSVGLTNLKSGMDSDKQLQENKTISFEGNSTDKLEAIVDPKPQSEGIETIEETMYNISQILNRIIPVKFVSLASQIYKSSSSNNDRENSSDAGASSASSLLMNGKNNKSLYYNAIRSGIPLLVTDYLLKKRTCKNRCGISHLCSCKPICLVFKTCCIDFMDSCGDYYNMTLFHQKYDWLHSLETECIGENVVVSSCRHQNQNNIQEYDYYQIDAKNIPSDLSSRGNTLRDVTSAQKGSTITYLLIHLLSMSQDSERQLSVEESVLISTPILDSSTGITYRNISMYMCNRASMEHAIVTTLYVPVEEEAELRSKSNANATTSHDTIDIFKMLNFSNACPCNWISKIEIVQENAEICHDDVIESCPEGFLDSDVIEACQSSSFLISSSSEINGKGSSRNRQLYKNPFCLFCHIFGRSGGPPELQVSNQGNCTCRKLYQYGFAINFSGYKESFDFSVDKRFRMTVPSVLCNLTLPSNNLGTRAANQTRLSDLEEHSYGPFLKTDCKADDCENYFRESNRCLAMWVIIIYLPPTRITLSDQYLRWMLHTLREIMREKIPGYWREVSASSVYFSRFEKTQTRYYGFEYDYSMHIGFYIELFGNDNWEYYVKFPIVDMFSRERSIFKQGQNYVCVAIERSLNSSNAYHCRNGFIFPVDGDTAVLTSGSPRLSSLGLTLIFVFYQFLNFFIFPLSSE